MDQSFTKTTEEVLAYFGVDENVGLTEEQVKKNFEKYGPNGEFRLIYFLSKFDYKLSLLIKDDDIW